MTNDDTANLGRSLSKHFNADLSDVSTQEALRERLALRIAELIDADFERLMAAFYRLDLNEAKVQDIITGSPSEQIPLALADLVIERELKKVETRRRYRNYFRDR